MGSQPRSVSRQSCWSSGSVPFFRGSWLRQTTAPRQEEPSPCFQLCSSPMRCAPPPAPPPPTAPATPPPSAPLLEDLLMETVLQGLLCDLHLHLWNQHLHQHHLHQEPKLPKLLHPLHHGLLRLHHQQGPGRHLPAQARLPVLLWPRHLHHCWYLHRLLDCCRTNWQESSLYLWN